MANIEKISKGARSPLTEWILNGYSSPEGRSDILDTTQESIENSAAEAKQRTPVTKKRKRSSASQNSTESLSDIVFTSSEERPVPPPVTKKVKLTSAEEVKALKLEIEKLKSVR